MAFSGSISTTTFNALKVVDHAFRRCRLAAQNITSEMQAYALESLYLMLSEMANIKTPSWCIERVVLPLYENQPIVPLPIGTVEVLNLNYLTLQMLDGDLTTTSTSYTVDFLSDTVVNSIGIKWADDSVPVTFEVSNDDILWYEVGSNSEAAVAGEIVWSEIDAAQAYRYFRIISDDPMIYSAIVLGNQPQEIPLGTLNRDTYVQQSNKVFPSRPNSYWFQRDIPIPVLHIWPAPFAAAEQAQLILWRHRHIMDTENLQQDVEIPQRWIEAIVNGLAARMAAETPQVDAALIPMLEGRATVSMQRAWDGDNDGSPTYINPGIGCYTK